MPPRAEVLRLAGVVAAALVLFGIYAFPGFMAWDSVDQLAQARAGRLTDWHPPLMSALWGVLDAVVAGPALMFVLQCGLFAGGLYVTLRRRLTARRAIIATLVIVAWPASFTAMAVVVKDSLIAGALLVGVACLTSARPRVRIAALVAFAFAAGLRHNALPIVVPLVAWLSPWPARRGPWVRRATGAAVALALSAVAMLGNRALADVRTYPFHYSVAQMDLVGTLHFAPPLTDAEIHARAPGLRFARMHGIQAHAHELYDVNRWWGSLIYGEHRFVDEPATPEARDAVTAAWWALITSEPGAYLTERADMMRALLGLVDGRLDAVYGATHERGMLAGTYQPPRKRNWVQRHLTVAFVDYSEWSLTFRGYVYVVLAIVLLIVLRRDPLVTALVASALCHLAALFVVAPAPDYRYVHWVIVTVMIGLAIRFLGVPSRPGDHEHDDGAAAAGGA